MHRILELAGIAAVVCRVFPAAADVTFEKTRPTASPQPSPRLRIMSPASKQVMTTHVVNGDVELPCALDDKDRWVTIAAENWPVKAGGPGVLVVLDGRYAANVHDLSKPISMAALEPFTEDKDDSLAVSPISSCGWHSVAIVPTLANGQMAAVPPVVTWYFNKPSRKGDSTHGTLEDQPAKPLIVINWPLMGTFYPGEVNGEPPGWIVSSLSKIPFDYTSVPTPKCNLRIEVRGQSERFVLNTPGMTYIKNVAGPSTELDWDVDCGDGAGASSEGVGIYAKAPSRVAALKWPTMSAAVAAADRAEQRAAHRLPGKRPYDGVFHGGGGEAFGNLTCPAVVKIASGVATFDIVLGHAMSFGSVKAKVDPDGYVDPQKFKLPRPKPLPGKAAEAADYTGEAKGITSVEVSGELDADPGQGAKGTYLDLKLEVVGPDGAKSGRGCSSRMFIEGFKREVRDCDTGDKCGTPGNMRCCRERP